MEAYGKFAGIYDRLMDDFDYPAWAEYYLKIIGLNGVQPKSICECACGTGSMTIEFAKKGIKVTASDLSADMLRIASEKARRNGQKIAFVCQNMTDIKLPRQVDTVICACDGVNYLVDDGALEGFFKSAANSLKAGGCLAFDISTRYKLEKVIGSGFFGEERDDVAYLWSNKADESKHTVDMDITFFVKDEDAGGLYRRFSELHHQRAYSQQEITEALEKCGFSDIKVYGDMTFTPPVDTDKRIHFTAVRK